MIEKYDDINGIIVTAIGLLSSAGTSVVTSEWFEWNFPGDLIIVILNAVIISISLELSFRIMKVQGKKMRFPIHIALISAWMLLFVFMAPYYAAYASFFAWGIGTLIIYLSVLFGVGRRMKFGFVVLGVLIGGAAFFFAFGGVDFNLGLSIFIWTSSITVILPIGIERQESA